jgi:hypothetical protein
MTRVNIYEITLKEQERNSNQFLVDKKERVKALNIYCINGNLILKTYQDITIAGYASGLWKQFKIINIS